jgi:hypothetical protein
MPGVIFLGVIAFANRRLTRKLYKKVGVTLKSKRRPAVEERLFTLKFIRFLFNNYLPGNCFSVAV